VGGAWRRGGACAALDASPFDARRSSAARSSLIALTSRRLSHSPAGRADSPEEAALLGKTRCILAGVPFFDAVFAELGCTVHWLAKEGDVIVPPMRVATVRGPCRNILLGERTALNILSRASGVASASRELVDIASAAGWHGEVAGTRKVTPGFRLVEKYALLVGGASTHRMDLSAMVMLKGACARRGAYSEQPVERHTLYARRARGERRSNIAAPRLPACLFSADNHVWAAGSITAAVKQARRAAGFSTKIEVEARDLAEATEAVRARAARGGGGSRSCSDAVLARHPTLCGGERLAIHHPAPRTHAAHTTQAAAGADIVMLDNYSPAALAEDARKLKEKFPHVLVEASGVSGPPAPAPHTILGGRRLRLHAQ
jgi:nicotinate-nucleotide pyrophosphorylase (carboxylating)